MRAPRLGLLATTLASLAFVACGPPKQADSPPPPASTTAPPASTSAPPPAKADVSAELAQAEAAISAKDLPKAKKALEAALVKDPKSAPAHYMMGVVADDAKDAAAAEAHYRKALELDPGLADAAVNLSGLLLDAGKAADAVALLKPFAAKADKTPALAQTFAFALGQAGDHQGAADEYAKLVKKTPGDAKLVLGLFDELLALGKKDDAAKVGKDAVAAFDGQRDVLAALGPRLGKAGAFDDAVAAMDKALKVKSSADLLTYRALFKRSKKDLPGARKDLEAATKEDPKFQPAWLYLGEVLEDEKKPADAKKAFQKAVEIAPDSPHGKKAKDKLDGKKK